MQIYQLSYYWYYVFEQIFRNKKIKPHASSRINFLHLQPYKKEIELFIHVNDIQKTFRKIHRIIKEYTMKTKNLSGLLLFICTISFVCCNDEDNTESAYRLELSENTCEVMQGRSSSINLISNENTTLEIADPELIDAAYIWGSHDNFTAAIEITGMDIICRCTRQQPWPDGYIRPERYYSIRWSESFQRGQDPKLQRALRLFLQALFPAYVWRSKGKAEDIQTVWRAVFGTEKIPQWLSMCHLGDRTCQFRFIDAWRWVPICNLCRTGPAIKSVEYLTFSVRYSAFL